MDAIIFSRVWSPNNVGVALRLAKLRCPECRVVYHHNSTSGVGWPDSYDLSNTFEDAMAFLGRRDEIYMDDCLDYQKCSIARWKMLRDWMIAESVQTVCFCDSDVLLYDNPFKTPHYEPGKLLLSDNHSGMVHAGNSIVTLEAVKAAWDNICRYIDDPGTTLKVVQDMATWNDVRKTFPWSDQNRVIDGIAWDHHMGWLGDSEWEDDGTGYKRIQWIDRNPHCLHLPSGKLVRLANLHCWGNAELRMPGLAAMGGLE